MSKRAWPNGSYSVEPPPVSSEFGYRTNPVTGQKGTMHNGIDLKATFALIKAPANGVVTLASYNGAAGLEFRMKDEEGTVFRLLHNSKLFVKKGQRVTMGQDVAVMGSTGQSTGDHCHEEVRPNGGAPINPRGYYQARNKTAEAPAGLPSEPLPTDDYDYEEDDMSRDIGVWYKKDNIGQGTYVYLIHNKTSGYVEEFSNGSGRGTMPGNYTKALKEAYGLPAWAEVTAGHANAIKASCAAIRPKASPTELKVEIVKDEELSALQPTG